MNNYSKQREIILKIIKQLKHPSIEEIYDKVHEVNPSISKSTVYRNINVLLTNKTIKKIKILTGPDRYDLVKEEHYHVICKECGKVYDFLYHFEQDELTKTVLSQTGVKTNIDSITLYGICKDCKSKESEGEI